MDIQKHDLINEFPELRDEIHRLKSENAHFRNIFEEYHSVDHEVRRIEMGVENTSDQYLEDQKKKRLLLKDQLYSMLTAEA